MKATYRKHNDSSQNSSTYHKKDGTAVRAILKREASREVASETETMKDNTIKFTAASIILTQLPNGRAIDNQTLMQEATALAHSARSASPEFDLADAQELRRRIEAMPKVYEIVRVNADVVGGLYLIWKRI